MIGGDPWISEPAAIVVLDIAVLTVLVAVGVAVIVNRNLFAVVMLSGAYSLLSALFFMTTDAIDVAFTEAAVGAGVTTILMLGAMLLTAREARKSPASRRWVPLVVVAAVGAVLLYATVDMPDFGDGESAANAYLGRAFMVRTMDEVGPPNVVTAVLGSYRGFDTLGEVVVIFTAGLGVMFILGLSGRPARDDAESASDTSPAREGADDGADGAAQ